MDFAVQPEEGSPDAKPVALHSQFIQLGDQLRTAQAEIGQIRLEREEEKKPWWRQTSTIISFAALLLSTGFSVYTAADQFRQKKANENKQRSIAFDTRMADLVALRMEDARESVALAATNLSAYRTWATSAAVKQAMSIDAALLAAHDLGDDISPTAAYALGNELILDGRYPEAVKIINRGLKAARNTEWAAVYMTQGGPFYNPSEGRKLYRQAIDSYSKRTDSNALNRN